MRFLDFPSWTVTSKPAIAFSSNHLKNQKAPNSVTRTAIMPTGEGFDKFKCQRFYILSCPKPCKGWVFMNYRFCGNCLSRLSEKYLDRLAGLMPNSPEWKDALYKLVHEERVPLFMEDFSAWDAIEDKNNENTENGLRRVGDKERHQEVKRRLMSRYLP